MGSDDERRSNGGTETSLSFKLGEHVSGATHETHKYQSDFQVLVILFFELFVVVFCFLTIDFVKACPIIMYLLAVQGV